MDNKTVFLSHSNKDIDKVRKIRNILESLEYEPLVFYLRCLDDNKQELESFIKKEIEARNFFIYCDSYNARNSEWVKKEKEYIEQFDSKRLFTINIDQSLQHTLVELLQSLANIIKQNRVFISCSHATPDSLFGDYIESILKENGYDIVRYKTIDRNADYDHKKSLCEATIFIPIISHNSIKSTYCSSELVYVLDSLENNPKAATIFPIYFCISPSLACKMLHSKLEFYPGIDTDDIDMLPQEKIDILLQSIRYSSPSPRD